MLKQPIEIVKNDEVIQAIIDQIPDPILYIKPDYTVTLMNKAANNLDLSVSINDSAKCYNLIHHSRFPCTEDIEYCPLEHVRSTKKPSISRHQRIDKKGDLHHVEISVSPMMDNEGSIIGYLEVMHDITEHLSIQHKLLQEAQRLSHISMHDPLTMLPNRKLLTDRIDQAIEHKSRSGEMFGVFFVDLDHFKNINDSLGHLMGDKLLIEVAKRMRQVCRKGDTVSRIGGDEFVLVIENGISNTHFVTVAAKIQSLFNDPFIIDGEKIFSTCSIGISVFPQDGTTTETLLNNADVAMYASKNVGRNQFRFFSSDMTQQAYAYLQMGDDLKTAIFNEEFVLHYQPLFDFHSKVCSSIEVLIRWNHPQKGFMRPDDFLPVAKKAGLMKEIDLWVIQKAFDTFSALLSRNIAPDTISVNITTSTLFLPEFLSVLEKMIDKSRIDPHRIVFEIIESQLIKDAIIAQNVIKELHKIGIQVALDNFGTGYSSLSYLIDFGINTLKIDQSSIHNLNEKGALLIKSIVSLSNTIGLKMVAQGVETKEQQSFLIDNGINTMQGYVITKPMIANDLIQFLENTYHKAV
ncbi:MAG: EAL domain-containing protein [Sulfuricurvum sp.]|uniref:GGDEF and EAL domain-containing protein n=1 Tax=Sulfuricurvum sp. TaxID=2025608 RepID=UPI002609571B|nr:GGDEF and EAL domain-containing protein [Sulfuricurvum sp.]MDD5158951.1 EAL domain-containing protein [Sulfuricurvum sp.]